MISYQVINIYWKHKGIDGVLVPLERQIWTPSSAQRCSHWPHYTQPIFHISLSSKFYSHHTKQVRKSFINNSKFTFTAVLLFASNTIDLEAISPIWIYLYSLNLAIEPICLLQSSWPCSAAGQLGERHCKNCESRSVCLPTVASFCPHQHAGMHTAPYASLRHTPARRKKQYDICISKLTSTTWQ